MTIAMITAQDPSEDPPNPPNPPNQSGGENEEGNVNDDHGGEPDFPHAALARLDEMIHRQRWVVPVLPKCELEILLDASIQLCSKGLDTRSEACQRFFREGLTISFTKILTDEAVNSWKLEIHKCILKNCEKLLELVVIKLPHDWFPLLDLLAMVLNPCSRFHTFNSSRPSETVGQGSQLSESEIYARPPDSRNPRGWLVDLVNLFGKLGGFELLLKRFQSDKTLTVAVVCSLLRPFGLCYEMLCVSTIHTYFMPIIEIVPSFLENLTDEELKKEAKNEAKNDALSTIIKAIKCLVSRIPSQHETAKNLEIFRLKMILRLLQISSFNGKMNALNEVNKVIANVSYHPHRHGQPEEEEWLTAERMAEWIKDNRVLQIVLRDSLHQPQYVEKLEKIIRFIIKERALTLDDLDDIWAAQHGKHEAIVKNVHDLLAKLAWDFSPEQLDHLFRCFQTSWSQASKKQREKLLELIRRLAEDDKDGVMAHKVLNLLWSLAHSDDVPTEIMDQALSAHVKILDYSCSQDRDAQKHHWLDRCVEELKHDKWVLPALKQIREICCSYSEAPPTVSQHQRPPSHVNYRPDVISKLQNQHSLVVLVADNLTTYMKNISLLLAKDNTNIVASEIFPDGRYNHIAQVQERLSFLRFLLKDGQLWLCAPQAKQIWNCLAENAVFQCDRESCFRWFSKLMGDDPDLDPEINKEFFENNILHLDPSYLTEHGMRCFDRFFKAVNSKEGKLLLKRRTYLMDDLQLIGMNYVWEVVLCSTEDIAQKAIELLKETFTNLGPRLQANQYLIHEDFIMNCISKLKLMYDSVSLLNRDKDGMNKVRQETTRMCRVLKVLYEYIAECDGDFGDDRSILPLARASRGKQLSLIVRFPVQGRQPDELEVWTHVNDTMGSVKRQVMQRLKSSAANVKVELFLNADSLETLDDKKMISHLSLRDKVILTGKLTQVGSNMASSPDSSSDSSTGSPHPYDGSNIEAENCLPGVIMANQTKYCQFLLQLADLGSSLNLPQLRDGARILLNLIPADQHTVVQLETLCLDQSKSIEETISPMLENTMFNVSPSTVLYNLQILYSLLMPALNPLTEKALEFQYNFMRSGGVKLVISMLTKNNFLSNADMATKRSSLLVVLKIAKLVFVTVGYSIVALMAGSINSSGSNNSPIANGVEAESKLDVGSGPSLAIIQVLQQALQHIPNPASDCMVRNVASRLAQSLHDQVTVTTSLWSQFMSGVFPDKSVVRSILKLIWASSLGHFQLINSPLEEIESASERLQSKPPDADDLQVCNEGLETLSVVLALYPPALESLSKETQFHKMVLSLVVHVKERMVRLTAVEQILLIATKCAPSPHTLVVFIVMLFNALNGHQKIYSKEYFQLLCGLLSWACISKVVLPGVERLLAAEVEWLKGVRQKVLRITRGTPDSPPVEEVLLEGHLCVTRELVAFLSSEKKWELGSENKNINLIRELIEDFIFPFSKVYLQLEHSSVTPAEQAIPVCSSQPTVIAAYDLLVSLCTGCVQNLNTLANMLTNMFYSDCEESLGEWEYLPPVGPRPHKGFVGLKNAGATCYMNSVLQQLYMIKAVREGVLSVEGAATDPDEDFSGEERLEHENNLEVSEDENVNSSSDESRKEYHIGILKQVQAIFAHLACSKLQYYVPKGLWKHFKLQGEPVNLREQHDACEFYNILVESINEALKALGENQILNKILGGSFSDQKICKTCPHRYSREEAFTVISIDIRNYSNLYDSLEQYVKGDLLEGDNAYLCEKCDKKVDTVKRICLKKLPPILAIQLKRFDYDWERECSIKFNDYFEFPRELDMEPYTVSGLARNGELIDYDAEDLKNQSCSKYKLTGIVVHSGQASGGHYYSYILHKMGSEQKWYKFDDGEVSECKMDDDEEMKNQCFGGEYVGEQVFDNIMKRVSYRRQKRWWNAYLLFYTRMEDSLLSSMNDLTLTDRPGLIKMPTAIERSVVRQNVRFLHSRSQFSPEYFQFLKNLIVTNHSFVSSPPQDRVTESEEVAMISTKLASKFLFSVGLHTKKTLRGPAQEWYEALQMHLRSSAATRGWFTQHVLFAQPHRFMEYLLECPAPEVRLVFSKLIVLVAHCSKSDPPQPVSWGPLKHLVVEGVPSCSLSDQLLIAVLLLLNKEVSEHGRHLLQYFHLFHMYSSYGPQEKLQLLKLNVVDTLMLVALDEGPGPAIKYQYPELGKLYQVVSQLIRCCDVSHKCQSSQTNKTPMPNPHGDNTIVEPLMPIQQKVAEILYGRPTYVKKIIEDSNTSEDTLKLLKFCCWENPMFSSMVLSELLWQIAYAYTYELRPYFDLLLHMLLLEDSWQDHRIHNALKGIPDEREGLFETMLRTKNHYQKRAYQCIKCMVALFATCKAANRMLNTNEELKRKWTAAVYWLSDELERRNYSTANQQYYNNWSPQAPSNETSNGYFLERSPSARSTLEKAYELCPEEIEGDECEEGEPALPDEMAPPPPTPTSSCEQTTSTVNPASTSNSEKTVLSLDKAPDSPTGTLSPKIRRRRTEYKSDYKRLGKYIMNKERGYGPPTSRPGTSSPNASVSSSEQQNVADSPSVTAAPTTTDTSNTSQTSEPSGNPSTDISQI